MRIEREQVIALVKKMREWGYTIDGDIQDDLVDEFDVNRENPGQKKPGGFRRTDPGTSKKAAFEATPRTGSQRCKALECILERRDHGSTYYDVESLTKINGVWKRLSELKEGGWIIASGTRKVGKTGAYADIYYPTAKAIAWKKWGS